MSRNIFIALLVIGLLPHFGWSQEKGFEISGHLDGLNDGEIVLLGSRFDDFHYLTKIDSCKVTRGTFHLKGSAVPDGPRMYEILFNESSHRIFNPNEGRNVGGVNCELFVDNGDEITISGGNINKMRNSDFSSEVKIEGSPSNFAKCSLMPTFYCIYSCYSNINNRLDKIRDSIGFDPSLVQGFIESKAMLDQALHNLFLSPVSAYYKPAIPLFLSFFENYHGFFLPDVYESLSDHYKNSYYGKRLQENKTLAIGQSLPGFTLPTPDKIMVSLKDIINRGKLTLVHIWASNSVEREKYQKELMDLYKIYHNKGLNIVGVSADSLADDWEFILHQKQYPWVNVSDLKGNHNGSIIQDLYHEGGRSIPNTTNILLDSEGKIIAWDVSGTELQWYLWKYLGN